MDELERKAIGGLLKLLVGMAGMMFVAAGTLRYWQAWLYLAVFGGTSFAIGQFLLAHDRTLLERRLRSGPAAERERFQKIVQSGNPGSGRMGTAG